MAAMQYPILLIIFMITSLYATSGKKGKLCKYFKKYCSITNQTNNMGLTYINYISTRKSKSVAVPLFQIIRYVILLQTFQQQPVTQVINITYIPNRITEVQGTGYCLVKSWIDTTRQIDTDQTLESLDYVKSFRI